MEEGEGGMILFVDVMFSPTSIYKPCEDYVNLSSPNP